MATKEGKRTKDKGLMKDKDLFKRYLIYLLRWQLSTPIIALCLYWLGGLGELPATIIANLIGAIIFFWVDMIIFRK